MASNYDENTVKAVASHIESIIRLLGEDPSREGLIKTPRRAAKALYYMTNGYRTNVDDVVNGAIFSHEGSGMIVVKDIEFYSQCEHHILPFFGKISIGYIPNGKMIGLSKLARIVEVFSRRLQVQERLTAQVVEEVMRVTHAKGVIARCEAQHLCMKMRGVEKQESSTATIEMSGIFYNNTELVAQFNSML